MTLTIKLAKQTRITNFINKLAKNHASPKIQKIATSLVVKWKTLLKHQIPISQPHQKQHENNVNDLRQEETRKRKLENSLEIVQSSKKAKYEGFIL